MNHTTDTQRTDAMPSNKSMLTAQSNPVELYQQLCKVAVAFGKALDACVEYRQKLNASQSDVERLKKELADWRELEEELEGYKKSFDILMAHCPKIIAELTNKTK